MANKSSAIAGYQILAKLSPQFVDRLTIAYVFGADGSEAIVVDKEDNVYLLDSKKTTTPVPTLLEPLCKMQVTDFAFGFNHVMALTKDGELFSWGSNTSGELGNGSSDDNHIPAPISALSDKQITGIACGAYHSLALTSDGQLYAWGHNKFGQVGNQSSNNNQLTPVNIGGSIEGRIVGIACGRFFSMALTDAGRVHSWGKNEFGQLGIASNRHQCSPICVHALSEKVIRQIACGPFHSLLLSADGDVYASGFNYYGQLGIGSKTLGIRNVPTKADTKDVRFVEIAASIYGEITAARTEGGVYYVWGKCVDDDVSEPKPVSTANSFNQVFLEYGNLKVTPKPITFSIE